MKSKKLIDNPREVRRKLHLSQEKFWGPLGVTQSGGSYYESGRKMPKSVKRLLALKWLPRLAAKRREEIRLAIKCFAKFFELTPQEAKMLLSATRR